LVDLEDGLSQIRQEMQEVPRIWSSQTPATFQPTTYYLHNILSSCGPLQNEKWTFLAHSPLAPKNANFVRSGRLLHQVD